MKDIIKNLLLKKFSSKLHDDLGMHWYVISCLALFAIAVLIARCAAS